jgi:hypothetical protein
MAERAFSTIGELAKEHSQPEWRVRKVVDSLGVPIPRAGQYRLIPASLLEEVGNRLRQQQAVAGATP